MAGTLRIGGSFGSATANLMLFGAIAGFWPTVTDCLCWRDGGPIEVLTIDSWRPFIDNPGKHALGDEPDPDCPVPGSSPLVDLVDAPLPEGFDPHGYDGQPLYACVRIDRAGRVVRASIPRSTGSAALDEKLLAEIRKGWSFRLDERSAEPPGWQRVRLTSGPINGTVAPPPVIL